MSSRQVYSCDICKADLGTTRPGEPLALGQMKHHGDYYRPASLVDACSECLKQYTELISRWMASKL